MDVLLCVLQQPCIGARVELINQLQWVCFGSSLCFAYQCRSVCCGGLFLSLLSSRVCLGGGRERNRSTRHRRHHVCLPVGRDGSPILYHKIITRCIHWRCNIRLRLGCAVRGISISQSYNTICVPRIPPGNRRTSQTVTGGRYNRPSSIPRNQKGSAQAASQGALHFHLYTRYMYCSQYYLRIHHLQFLHQNQVTKILLRIFVWLFKIYVLGCSRRKTRRGACNDHC